ncbi:MAG: hypothetical protein ABSG31_12620 [Tepidisphaeraceae bacterium]|jgi:hypothetical protein
MTQENSSSFDSANQRPNDPGANPPGGLGPASPAPDGKPKKKKRRIILKILGVLVVLLILLVLLIPTIASTGMVKDIVVSQINNNLVQGKLEIKDWSIGWTSGIHLSGVSLMDLRDNSYLAQIGQIDLPISLIKAASMNIDLGDSQIVNADVNLKRLPDGEINLLRLIKPSPPSNSPPSKLPNVTGSLHIRNASGTFEDDLKGGTAAADGINVDVHIPDINKPIEDTISIHTLLMNHDFSNVRITGTISAIRDNLVDIDHLGASQTIDVTGDLSALQPMLKPYASLDMSLGGKLDGEIKVDVDTLNNIAATGKITIDSPTLGGGPLHLDTVQCQQLAVELNAALAGQSVKVDIPITASYATNGKPDLVDLHVDASRDTLLQTQALLQAIGQTFVNPSAPTVAINVPGAGVIQVSVDIDAANFVNQLRNTVHLIPGVTLSNGRFASATTVTIGDGKAVIDAQNHITDFAGTNNGQPVHLDNIDSVVGITAQGGDKPGFHQPSVSINSGFFNLKGGGEELGKTSFDGAIDFSALQQQVSQLIDLDALMQVPKGQHVTMSGAVAFHAETDGDPTAQQSVVHVAANAKVNDLKISGLGSSAQSIEQPNFNGAIACDLDHTSVKFVQDIRNLKITAQSPAIDFDADADVNLDGPFGFTLPAFAINRGTIDLAQLQNEFGGAVAFVLKRNDLPRVVNGKLILTGKGKFDPSGFGFEQPLTLHIDPTDVSMADASGKMQQLHLESLDVTVSGNGSVNPDTKITTLKGLTITATVGDAAQPTFAAELASDLTVSPTQVAAQSISLDKCTGDLTKLQNQILPVLAVVMPPSPATTQPSLVQQLADGSMRITSGQFSAQLAASYLDKKLTITQPLTAGISNLTLTKDGQPTAITNENLTATASAQVEQGPNQLSLQLQSLSLALGDQLSIQLDPAHSLVATLGPTGISATGDINLLNADLPPLLQFASLVLPPDQMATLNRLTSGKASGNIQFGPGADGATSAKMDVTINQITVYPPATTGQAVALMSNETIHIVTGGTLSQDMSAISDAMLNVESSFGKNINISNANILLARKGANGVLVPTGIFDKLQSADIEIDNANMRRLDVFVGFLSPPSPDQTPLVIGAGDLTFKAHVARSQNTTTATLSALTIQGLQVSRGSRTRTWPGDINIQAVASLDTDPNAAPDAPIMNQLAKFTLSAMSVNGGIASIQLYNKQPIIVTGFDDLMTKGSVTGGVTFDGQIQPAARLAEMVANVPTGTYPYKGEYHLDEPIQQAPGSRAIVLTGGGWVKDFEVDSMPPVPGTSGNPPAAAPSVVFQEKEVDINNPLTFDMGTDSVSIDPAHPVLFALKSSGALSVTVSGTVNDLQVKREIKGIVVTADYDSAKLWEIIKPLVPPDQLAKVSDLETSGVKHEVIKVDGSYPAFQPFNRAIATVVASGALGIGHISTNGITIDNFELPFALKDGIFYTKYADLPDGQNAPKAAQCNSGTITVPIIVSDLTSDDMLTSIPAAAPNNPAPILTNISLNPALAKTMFGKLLNNPLFLGASSANGQVNLKVLKMQTVPMSALVDEQTPKNPGVAEIQYSISKLQMGSPLLALLPGWNTSLSAEINNGDVQLAQGVITEDSTLMLNGNAPLRAWGKVGLQTKQFMPMQMSIPRVLFERAIPGNIRQWLPQYYVAVMKGNMDHPQVSIDLKQLAADAAKQAALNAVGLGNLGTTQPSQQQQQPLNPGNLLNGLFHH